MTRIAIGIEYDGSSYHGWQSQAGLNTVQAVLEKALSQVANEPIQVTCAGRTDTGVHALGQVVHFDTQADRKLTAWTLGANTLLPDDVTVKWVKEVSNDFHARFSALCRHYRYLIYNHNVPSAIFRHCTMWYARPLDEVAMRKASQYLLGEHDFSSFRGADCQSKTPQRRIDRIVINRQSALISIDIIANAFLHHMVRNIIGTLLPVGLGKVAPEWVKAVLLARDRQQAGATAPANGLFLLQVDYPSEFKIPQSQGLNSLLLTHEVT